MTDETKLIALLNRLSKTLPHFSDGRIDYSGSKKAPVLNCFVKYEGKILILKRSQKVGNYKGKWNAIAGYIDEIKPLRMKILEELKEEIDIPPDNIEKIKIGSSYSFKDPSIDKTWIVWPVLVEIKKSPSIHLDWEHTEYRWIKIEELDNFDAVFNLKETLNRLIN